MRLNFQDSFLLLPSFLNRSTDLVCISRRYNISLYSTSCQGRILHQVTKGWQVFPGFFRCSGQKLKARQIFSNRLHYHKNIALTVRPLAKRTRKSTQVNASFRLAFRLAALAVSWSGSNSYASRRKFFIAGPPNRSRHKLIGSHRLSMRQIYGFCDLRELASLLSPHRKFVRKCWFWKLASTWFDLRVRLARACRIQT